MSAQATQGFRTISLNFNPETVSTDFDESDRLYFDEISLERVLDIVEFERPFIVVVSFGGQIASNQVVALAEAGVPSSAPHHQAFAGLRTGSNTLRCFGGLELHSPNGLGSQQWQKHVRSLSGSAFASSTHNSSFILALLPRSASQQ